MPNVATGFTQGIEVIALAVAATEEEIVRRRREESTAASSTTGLSIAQPNSLPSDDGQADRDVKHA